MGAPDEDLHRIADGIATMHLVSGLSDGGEGDIVRNRDSCRYRATKEAVSATNVSLNPLDWATGTWRPPRATSAALLAVEGAIEITGGLLSPAAQSSLIGSRHHHAALQRGAGESEEGEGATHSKLPQRCRIGRDHRQAPSRAVRRMTQTHHPTLVPGVHSLQ